MHNNVLIIVITDDVDDDGCDDDDGKYANYDCDDTVLINSMGASLPPRQSYKRIRAGGWATRGQDIKGEIRKFCDDYYDIIKPMVIMIIIILPGQTEPTASCWRRWQRGSKSPGDIFLDEKDDDWRIDEWLWQIAKRVTKWQRVTEYCDEGDTLVD